MVANRREELTVADSVHLKVSDPGTLHYMQSFLTEDPNDVSTPAHYALLRALYECPDGLQAQNFGSLLDRDASGLGMFQGYLLSGHFRVTYTEANRVALANLAREDLKSEFVGRVFADLAQNWLVTQELPEGDILLPEERVFQLSKELFPDAKVVEKKYQKPHLRCQKDGTRTYVADAIALRMVDGDPRISNMYEYSTVGEKRSKYTDQYEIFTQLKGKYPSLFLPEPEPGVGTRFVVIVPRSEEGEESDNEQATLENRAILPGKKDVDVVYIPFDRTRFSEFMRYLFHGYRASERVRSKSGKVLPGSESATLYELWREGREQRTMRVTIVDFSLEESLREMGIILPPEKLSLPEVA